MRVLDLLRPPLVAIDVGTAATRVCFGSGEVLEEPSVVTEDGCARPVMRGGVVSDIAGVAGIIEMLLARRRRTWRRRPGAVVCAPTDVTAQERDALIEAVAAGGASVVTVVPEPLAAAVGVGVDLASEYATAVVDVGDGVTDIAVFRNAAMIFSSAKRIGCGTLRAALRDWLELRRGVELPQETIEARVRAYCDRSLRTDELEMLLEPVIDDIAAFIATTLHGLPDALAAEVIESGISITGGGAKLARLVERIEARVGLPVERPGQPLTAVIRGATEMLRDRRLLTSATADAPGR